MDSGKGQQQVAVPASIGERQQQIAAPARIGEGQQIAAPARIGEGQQQVAVPARLVRLLLLFLLTSLLLQEETALTFILRSRSAPLAHLRPTTSTASQRQRPVIPFCSSQDTHLLCDEGGEIEVSVPAWALAPIPPAREMAVLPDPLTLPWSLSEGSQHGEDGFLTRELFFGVEGGLMVESGALDGRLFSTSAGLVKARGWRAVHVEGSPDNFRALVRNRPESLNINAALCSSAQTLHYVSDKIVEAAGVARPGVDLNSEGITPVSGFWEFMSGDVRSRWWAGLTDSVVATFPPTPCRSLSHLLGLFGISHVHVWVLDVEGAESSVLAGFDFKAVRVDVVLIELDGSNPGKDEEARALLRAAGFGLHRRGHPHPFHLPDDPELQHENTMASAIGMDNEWWVNQGFSISYEGMVRASRGDTAWTPHSQQRRGPYPDTTQCCYSRNPD